MALGGEELLLRRRGGRYSGSNGNIFAIPLLRMQWSEGVNNLPGDHDLRNQGGANFSI